MKKPVIVFLIFLGIFAAGYFWWLQSFNLAVNQAPKRPTQVVNPTTTPAAVADPLTIAAMKTKTYPGSPLVIESTLNSGVNYHRYVVSYLSDGLKLYGLLTVPTGTKPAGGWPVILFNHGYIPPAQYSTVNSYASFVGPLVSAGYIVFKPDYRGNGDSPGTPVQIYVSPVYLTDSLNALASVKQYPDANPTKIGVLGHSMGGNITLHELVIYPDFRAAELLSGVVGNETGIVNWWLKRIANHSIVGNDLDASYIVQQMIKDYGLPADNPAYWNSIDPTYYISDVTAPVQIQVGTADREVPPVFSSSLRDSLERAGKTVFYRSYPGADHNLAPDTSTALTETVAFFNKYLK